MAYRIERVNSLIRQEISELIQHQAKDPRLGGLVSVTEVATAPDLKYARVFISGICDEAKKKETLEVLVTSVLQTAAGRMIFAKLPSGDDFINE